MPYVNTGENEAKHETILVEHLWEFYSISFSEGARSDRWMYFRCRFIEAPVEFYDPESDPMETYNFALKIDFEFVLHFFRNELDSKIRQFTDAKLVSGFTAPENISK